MQKGEKYPAEPVSNDELEAILKTCSTRAPSGIRDRALLLLMRFCGLRIGEAVNARRSAYRQAKGTLQVVHKHKTTSGRRVVGVPSAVALALERWQAWTWTSRSRVKFTA